MKADPLRSGQDLIQGLYRAARPDRRRTIALPPIDFTLVTGFLGSGKTSLVNHILASSDNRRRVVLVNDFGSINVDAALIRSRTERVMELANGCACCSIAAGLADILDELADSAAPPADVILEASGVAEPDGIVLTAAASGRFRVNAIVTMIDAENFRSTVMLPELAETVHRQIRAADLLILGKTDQVSAEERRRVVRAAAAIAPRARVIAAEHGRVPLALIFSADAPLGRPASAKPAQAHLPALASRNLPVPAPLSAAVLSKFLDTLPLGIFRLKGFVELISAPGVRQLVQFAGRRWTVEPLPGDGARADSCELVAIGFIEALDQLKPPLLVSP